jgi:hypothetical protein
MSVVQDGTWTCCLQVVCVLDKICYSTPADPAIPTQAANAVIPLAILTALFVVPVSLYSVNPEASKRVVLAASFASVSPAWSVGG